MLIAREIAHLCSMDKTAPRNAVAETSFCKHDLRRSLDDFSERYLASVVFSMSKGAVAPPFDSDFEVRATERNRDCMVIMLTRYDVVEDKVIARFVRAAL